MLRVLDEGPLFWRVQAHCLQASLLITLGRIFDEDPRSRSIHTVVNATIGHPELFSKQALAGRKRGGGPKPEWLDDFITAAWAPTSAGELRHLKRGLAEHNARFAAVYRPIRHAVFAHRLMSNDQAAFELFNKTNRDEARASLDFLHDLIDAIRELYVNGVRPELGTRCDTAYNQQIRNGTEKVLRKLLPRPARS